MIYTISLTRPPSTNNLFATSFATKRRFESSDYKAWKKVARAAILAQDTVFFEVPVKVLYDLGRSPDKRRRDLFNYEKAISDALVENGILQDDCLIEQGVLRWSSEVEPGMVKVLVVTAD